MEPRASAPPAWLVARPIAHRGLHDAGRGVIENSRAAADAAIAAGFAIECDVQLTADGDAIVFHDFSLDRLTAQAGLVLDRGAAELQRTAYALGQDNIQSLSDLLAQIRGQVPLICEIKSRFDGNMRLTNRVAALAAAYAGPLAIKSFDPAVIAHLRRAAPCPLGIVAEADYSAADYAALSPSDRHALANLLHFGETRPDFLSYHVGDLPHAVPHLCRTGMGMPVMTWTVRRPEQRVLAERWADQIVFEGFRP